MVFSISQILEEGRAEDEGVLHLRIGDGDPHTVSRLGRSHGSDIGDGDRGIVEGKLHAHQAAGCGRGDGGADDLKIRLDLLIDLRLDVLPDIVGKALHLLDFTLHGEHQIRFLPARGRRSEW